MGKLLEGNSGMILFTLIYIAILAGMYYILETLAIGLRTEYSIYELFFLTLATFRMTRLIVYDAIMQFFRECFIGKPGICVVAHKLISCPWCMSVWIAPFIVFLYLLEPQIMLFYIILALSGMATVLQIITNNIGWHAEKAKKEVQRK